MAVLVHIISSRAMLCFSIAQKMRRAPQKRPETASRRAPFCAGSLKRAFACRPGRHVYCRETARTGPGRSYPERTGTIRMDHPIVHIAFYEDAFSTASGLASSCPWKQNSNLPHGAGLDRKRYALGDEFMPGGKHNPNTFRGHFPDTNTGEDGYLATAPVSSFPSNGYGLFDMAGNVWEWTSDWYRRTTIECRRGCSAVGHFFASTSAARGTSPADEARENSTPERITSLFVACAMFRQNQTSLKRCSARYNTAVLSTADWQLHWTCETLRRVDAVPQPSSGMAAVPLEKVLNRRDPSVIKQTAPHYPCNKMEDNVPRFDQNTLAMQRNFMAAQRTLMSWIRTSISMIGFGFTLAKVFQSLAEQNILLKGPRGNVWTAEGVGMALISLGTFALIMAVLDHRREVKWLRTGGLEVRFSLPAGVASVLAILGVTTFLWVIVDF